jgi:Flp pilus assembly pilin Flp
MSVFLYYVFIRRPWRAMTHQHGVSQRGQATTEYALILLVAAVIATLVIAWATFGGGSGRIGELFDTIFDGILQRADPATP